MVTIRDEKLSRSYRTDDSLQRLGVVDASEAMAHAVGRRELTDHLGRIKDAIQLALWISDTA